MTAGEPEAESGRFGRLIIDIDLSVFELLDGKRSDGSAVFGLSCGLSISMRTGELTFEASRGVGLAIELMLPETE